MEFAWKLDHLWGEIGAIESEINWIGQYWSLNWTSSNWIDPDMMKSLLAAVGLQDHHLSEPLQIYRLSG